MGGESRRSSSPPLTPILVLKVDTIEDTSRTLLSILRTDFGRAAASPLIFGETARDFGRSALRRYVTSRGNENKFADSGTRGTWHAERHEESDRSCTAINVYRLGRAIGERYERTATSRDRNCGRRRADAADTPRVKSNARRALYLTSVVSCWYRSPAAWNAKAKRDVTYACAPRVCNVLGKNGWNAR